MRFLVFNCGSSSLKFELLELEGNVRRALARGKIEEIGPHAQAEIRIGDHWSTLAIAAADHASAAVRVLDVLRPLFEPQRPDAVVHRIVHGGAEVTRAALADPTVINALEDASRFAPLHNPPALATLRVVSARLAGVSTVVVPDTAFHHTMPEHARTYAIPRELARRHGIRRFGFHGVGHAWMAERYSEISDTPAAQLRLITLQLGSGCSACATSGGHSIDTSMGLTPLEGLMMRTRSGDLDPAITGYLMRAGHLSVDEVEHIFNSQSGLAGIARRSDVRELEAADDADAALALTMFCYRVRKYIGAYLAVLGGADAIIFGGGIGENSSAMRARICGGLEALGIMLDETRNRAADGHEGRISTDASPIKLCVIPLDEELYMARAAMRLLTHN
ncbi:MAG: acetate/propionate family kinase [Candidatus Binataceae bacterium]